MVHGAMGYALGVVHQTVMMRDVGGGCVSEEGQKDEYLFQLHYLS